MTAARRLALAGALALPACGARAPGGQSVEVARRWAVPAADVGTRCDDLSDTRICWDSRGEASRVARDVPPFAPPTPLGFRCSGQGAERTCEPRDRAGLFACDGSTCTQRHPRQPDDGEWECADDSGVTVCTGGEPPSGVPSAKPAPGWSCGSRACRDDARAPQSERSSRVCVDLSPDFPGGSASGLSCRWSYERGVTRTCALDPEAHVVGDPCDAGHLCVAGARCAGGRCAPPRPAPACWLDADCTGGPCRFGSCVVVGP